ncbi:DNA transformation protein [Lewinella marina]|uniref:TfoX N-terminal domain-containing protein n=1 Tax=Neolewinella marina TaxID=438751 RepID=A0A2G0CBL0_9BACT|nr:TfoX/Sxy family protein [Neolewinella marina]NJB87127.1 DNA transformation protein [Neolewinella marina]PHK97346.1 hypothetical protein CGL56_16195 [Neolewinella marina]
MAVSEDYITYLRDQLADLGEITGKKMFGGYGFFHEGKMFAMVGHGAFRLKVDDTNRQDFVDRGMEPFHSGGKKKGMPYWEVPVEVIEDRAELTRWARKSVAIAHSA